MDNASKALIIAGSVLVSILLVATGVQVYNSTGKGSADNAKQASEKMWDGVDLNLGLYLIGDEVTIEGEMFYVIGENQDNLILLAKDCIDTTTLKQSAEANTIAFSAANYWSSSFTDINENGEPNSNRFALKAAYDYGKKIGGKGRLMTKGEAESLMTNYSDIISGKNGKSSKNFLSYWLGTHHAVGQIFLVFGKDEKIASYPGTSGSVCMVRPVVEISRSKL